MKFLLDTPTVIWASLSPALLSETAAASISDGANEIFVSAVSAWEIATKVRLGKLPEAVKFERRFMETMEEAGYQLLPITTPVALRAGRLVADHGDPFDRMIAAEGLAFDIPIISKDRKLDQFGVRRIW